MTILRQMRHELAYYIDDKIEMVVEKNIIDFRAILTSLGFMINDGKSVFNLIPKLEHIIFLIHFRLIWTYGISHWLHADDNQLEWKKKKKLKTLCNKILNDSSGSVTVSGYPRILFNCCTIWPVFL